ncbi:NAD(P)-binding Rossmann-fold containing protein [Glarea lozoyensis ATCC 20868]|uniref:NAD(P)-binding Rossmann-fold containing protein n=1 Tax=Glarea lozoyensis (strain ATCC 20868 / MF5171) TaxID=1116229 RepID=S3DG45_GLAL2|nr:NAD(P)-binding Rossmann-fold containing protein [Glarea lozoyensis ATCC 20868]EPE25598.1 NAD(P)-binding Rossmann-fold containing protein [Glarea lozoyensis ATCC 20868]
MDLSLALEDTHVLITGGTGFIGSSTVSSFLAAGARVTSLDLKPPPEEENPRFQFLTCDISSEEDLASAFENAAKTFGPVATCIALASLDLSVLDHHESLADMNIEQWRKTHRVNVEGTFLTARTWLKSLKNLAGTEEATLLAKNVSLIIIGSESGWFGERGNADYAAGKSAVQWGLLKSLVGDVGRIWPGARVNAVAPGPVDTVQFQKECQQNPDQYYLDAQATTGLKRPVPPQDVAKSILFLASQNWSGSITGHVLNVDCGKQGKVMWTKDDLHGN